LEQVLIILGGVALMLLGGGFALWAVNRLLTIIFGDRVGHIATTVLVGVPMLIYLVVGLAQVWRDSWVAAVVIVLVSVALGYRRD
jgi:hypothetical protein